MSTLPLWASTTFCTRWLKSYTCIGGTGGLAGLIRVAGAALAAEIAGGDASSPRGGGTTLAILCAPGPGGLIVGVAGAATVGGAALVGMTDGGGSGGRFSGGSSAVWIGTVLGAGAGRGAEPSHTFAV